jgi:hypothetical protein
VVAVGNETLLFLVSQVHRILHEMMAGFWVPQNRDLTQWGPREIPSLSVSLMYPTFACKSTGDCVSGEQRREF